MTDVIRDVASRPVERIHVIDTGFGWHLPRLKAVAPQLSNLEKALTVSTRVEYALDPERLELFLEAGVKTLKIGVESLVDSVRFSMNKTPSADTVVEGLARIHESGIEVFGYLVLGYPGETPETARRTFDRVRDLAAFVKWLPNIYVPHDDPSPLGHHCSRPQARRLGLPEQLVGEFFRLAVRPADSTPRTEPNLVAAMAGT